MMPEVKIGGVPFKEAIEHLQGKLQIPTQHWDDMLGASHAKGFTIAGATKADLLNDLYQSVLQVKKNGGTISDFRKDFDHIVQKHGWSYKGKRGWRTRVIYDTNLRTAHMAGKWSQFQRVKKARPYLQYLTVGDQRVRPQHAQWNGKVLPIDDPYWDTNYPPNGFGCRCTVRSLSERQMKHDGLTISKSPTIKTTPRVNIRTGEDYGEVPIGIDVGWDYNVGKAWLGPDIAFGEKLISMAAPLRAQALKGAGMLTPHLVKVFSPWVNRLLKRKRPLGEINTVGYLTPSVVDTLEKRGLRPTTAVITVTDKEIMHLLREAKDGKHLPIDLIRGLPSYLSSPKAILWDKRNPALLYVFDAPGDHRKGKLVVRINYRTRGRGNDEKRYHTPTNSVRTGGLVELHNLKEKEIYEILEGRL